MEASPSHSNSNHSDGPYSYMNSMTNLTSSEDMNILRDKYKQSDNKVYHDFYKTKMCSLFNLNICKKGKDCPFAHSPDELRDKPNLYKTKLCDAFFQGQCTREDCHFAHGEEELRSTPDLFKTAICNLWTQGKCTNGDSCRFAHGYDDLRPAPSHRKFKKRHHHENKPAPTHHHNYQQNTYYNQPYNNQYSYPPQVYSYPMYNMPMMTGDMQSPYGMNQQPYGGYNPGPQPSRKH